MSPILGTFLVGLFGYGMGFLLAEFVATIIVSEAKV